MHLISLVVGLVLLAHFHFVLASGAYLLRGIQGHVLKNPPRSALPRLHDINIDETNILLDRHVFTSVDLVHVGTPFILVAMLASCTLLIREGLYQPYL